jgi:DNA-binding NarL/FixJ family response regulator
MAITGPQAELVSPDGRATTGVFIVTPIKLYRDGIAHFLQSSSELVVLGTAEESATTIRRARELLPDVILLDMALDESRATARALRAALPHTALVALAVPESEADILGCAEAGISAYVPLEGSLQELLATVRDAVRGEARCSPRIAASLIRRIAALSSRESEPATSAQATGRLTAREREVLVLIEDGLSNKQIARRLYIELSTVKNHVHSILEKLGATSRSDAAARVRRIGSGGPAHLGVEVDKISPLSSDSHMDGVG